MARIAFIGLGVMGGPMARHLAAAGHHVEQRVVLVDVAVAGVGDHPPRGGRGVRERHAVAVTGQLAGHRGVQSRGLQRRDQGRVGDGESGAGPGDHLAQEARAGGQPDRHRGRLGHRGSLLRGGEWSGATRLRPAMAR